MNLHWHIIINWSPMWLCHCELSTSNEWESLLFHVFIYIWYCQSLEFGPSIQHIMVFIFILICFSLMTYNVGHTFICLFAFCICSLVSVKVFWPFYIQMFIFLFWVLWILCIFLVIALCGIFFCKYFLICHLSSHSFDIIFSE